MTPDPAVSRAPGATMLVAEGLSHVADGVGLVLLALLAVRMFFSFDAAFQGYALAVGVLGMLSCWANRAALKNVPAVLLAYVAIGLLSAAVHRWPAVAASADATWWALFTPAAHLAVMAVFIYGAAHLLRTPARLTGLVILMVAATAVLATQIAFDRASAGFVYVRSGPSLPSVPQWGGLHGTSLLLTLALPLASASIITSPSVWQKLAGGILAGGLLTTAYLNGSRGGYVAMGLVMGAMILLAIVRHSSRPRQPLVWALGAGVGAAGLAGVWLFRANFENGADLTGRTFLWNAAAQMIRDHPWLGVGPGNYYQGIEAGGYAKSFPAYYASAHNAHNLMLHVTAEIGVTGGLCLAALMMWALRACWRTSQSGYVPTISLGLLLAVAGYLAHSQSQHFLDARVDVERQRLLLSMLLAAILALQRLPKTRTATRAC